MPSGAPLATEQNLSTTFLQSFTEITLVVLFSSYILHPSAVSTTCPENSHSVCMFSTYTGDLMKGV